MASLLELAVSLELPIPTPSPSTTTPRTGPKAGWSAPETWPLGSSPSGTFRVLYAAADAPTAFAEAVLRDDRLEPRIDLLDLRAAAPFEIGIDTDTSRARSPTPG